MTVFLNEVAWHKDDATPYQMIQTLLPTERDRENPALAHVLPPPGREASHRKLKHYALATCRRRLYLTGGLETGDMKDRRLCEKILTHVEEIVDCGVMNKKQRGRHTRLQDQADSMRTVMPNLSARLNAKYDFICLLRDGHSAGSECARGVRRIDDCTGRELVKCIFGNPWGKLPLWRLDRRNWEAGGSKMGPFRPGLGPIKEVWTNWCTPDVVSCAEHLYSLGDWSSKETRGLRDALEEAGCNFTPFFEHLGKSGVDGSLGDEVGIHCRGCWVIDLILGYS